jgi:hypothetical protein
VALFAPHVGFCKEMAMTKLKMVLALVLATGLAGTGAGVWAYRASGAPPTRAVAREKARESRPGDDRPRKPRPAAPAKEEKERPEEKPDAALEQLVTRLREAAAENEKAQTLLDRLEEEALKGRIEARQRVAEAEERLRLADRLHDIDRERERAEVRAIVARLTDPARKKEDVDRDRGQLDRLEARAREREKARTAQRIEARQELIRVEEKQRQVDRQSALRRKFAEARVEAAEQRVQALEDLVRQAQTKARTSPALEKKLDELLRAVQQLRRQLEERRRR